MSESLVCPWCYRAFTGKFASKNHAAHDQNECRSKQQALKESQAEMESAKAARKEEKNSKKRRVREVLGRSDTEESEDDSCGHRSPQRASLGEESTPAASSQSQFNVLGSDRMEEPSSNQQPPPGTQRKKSVAEDPNVLPPGARDLTADLKAYILSMTKKGGVLCDEELTELAEEIERMGLSLNKQNIMLSYLRKKMKDSPWIPKSGKDLSSKINAKISDAGVVSNSMRKVDSNVMSSVKK